MRPPFLPRTLYYRRPVLRRDAFRARAPRTPLSQRGRGPRSLRLRFVALLAENAGRGKKHTRRRTQANDAAGERVLDACSVALGMGQEDRDGGWVEVHLALYSLAHETSVLGYVLRETHRVVIPVVSALGNPATAPSHVVTLASDLSRLRGEEVILVIQVAPSKAATPGTTTTTTTASAAVQGGTLTSCTSGALALPCEACTIARSLAREGYGRDETHLLSGSMDVFQGLHGEDFTPVLHGSMQLWGHDLTSLKAPCYYQVGLKPHPSMCAAGVSPDQLTSRWDLCFSIQYDAKGPAGRVVGCAHHLAAGAAAVRSGGVMQQRHGGGSLPRTTPSRPVTLRDAQESKATREWQYEKLFSLPVHVLMEGSEEMLLLDWRCPLCNMFCNDLDGLRWHGQCSHEAFVWESRNVGGQRLELEVVRRSRSSSSAAAADVGAAAPRLPSDPSLTVIALHPVRGKRDVRMRYVNPHRFVHPLTFEPLPGGLDDEQACPVVEAGDPAWWLEKEERKMREYLDLSREEKDLMLQWNAFFGSQARTSMLDSNGKLRPQVVAEFLGSSGAGAGSRVSVLMLLVTLVDMGVLTELGLSEVVSRFGAAHR